MLPPTLFDIPFSAKAEFRAINLSMVQFVVMSFLLINRSKQLSERSIVILLITIPVLD